MNIYRHEIEIIHPFGNLYRKRHVLIALIDENNQILLGSKPKFYPSGIYRLIGGGVNNDNEEIFYAARRELEEETGLIVKAKEPNLLAQIDTRAISTEREFNLSTFLFYIKVNSNELKASDDIENLVSHSYKELMELIKRYYLLSTDEWYINGDYKHCWNDYGKVYGYIHQMLMDELKLNF